MKAENWKFCLFYFFPFHHKTWNNFLGKFNGCQKIFYIKKKTIRAGFFFVLNCLESLVFFHLPASMYCQ